MRQGRIYVALCVLAGLWIGVYWLWDAPGSPASSPRVTFATTPQGPIEQTEIEPPVPEPFVEPVTTGVIAPEFTTYTIEREGLTWADISQDVFATPAHAGAIADANPFVVHLSVGKEVRVPVDPANTRGVPVGEDDPADPPTNPPQDPGIIAEHVVESGEVLGEISRRYYGSSSHWRVIFEFNRDALQIESERDIRPGDVLKIPALPEG